MIIIIKDEISSTDLTSNLISLVMPAITNSQISPSINTVPTIATTNTFATETATPSSSSSSFEISLAQIQTIATTTETSLSHLPPHSISSFRMKNLHSHHQTLRSQQISRTAIKLSPAATNSTLKTHKTDAPMLNYIFDSHLATNKHHHHDR